MTGITNLHENKRGGVAKYFRKHSELDKDKLNPSMEDSWKLFYIMYKINLQEGT